MTSSEEITSSTADQNLSNEQDANNPPTDLQNGTTDDDVIAKPQGGATNENSGNDDNNNAPATESKRSFDNAPAPSRTRKRMKKCPAKDSILIHVPLHVTADLGVAMRRTRRKRVRRIQRWVESVTEKGEETEKAVVGETTKNPLSLDKKGTDESVSDNDEGKKERRSSLDIDDDESNVGPPRREQYGSVLDYLEAKYVRGVVIADYDANGERVKRKKSEWSGKEKSESDEVSDSDQDNNRSCYGDDDFIDDSLLEEEVVDQVFASDSYGKTKIEDEARKRKRIERESSGEGGDVKKDLGEGENDEDISAEGADSDFDDGFFVNLGDLEMAEGWRGDTDIVISHKRKPGRPKKAESDEESSEPTPKKRKKDDDVAPPKKKKKLKLPKDDVSPKITSEQNGGESKAENLEKKAIAVKKKKNSISSSSIENGKKKQPATNHAAPTAKATTSKKIAKPKEEPQTPKSIAEQLAKLVKRRYNICVKMINELTPKQLPRKRKNKTTAKISVSIPADKNIGDYIMFTNPHVPGQKLKVQIPAKANMETRSFYATVPMPKGQTAEPKENDLPKELKEALFDYSTAYDDWVNAKGK
eukprot:CCRYP_016853-RB/>CCRYP_016853-RB protein AED:0.02 eAED:0.02 QI:102/1/1/1/1/1/2/489/587